MKVVVLPDKSTAFTRQKHRFYPVKAVLLQSIDYQIVAKHKVYVSTQTANFSAPHSDLSEIILKFAKRNTRLRHKTKDCYKKHLLNI